MRAKVQHEFIWVCQFFFSKHQNEVIFVLSLLISKTWMTIKSSVVIFQALEISLALSLTLAAFATSLASKALFPQ